MNTLVDLALIVGLAELLNRMGVKGRWNLLATTALGTGLGVLVSLVGDAVWLQALLLYLRLSLAAVGVLSTGMAAISTFKDTAYALPWSL